MWLILRVLSFQEEYIILNEESSINDYKNGLTPFCDKRSFVVDCTGLNLFKSILPSFFKKSIRPRREDEENIKVNKKKIREFDSLIELAKIKGFIEVPKENMVSIGVVSKLPKKISPSIRLSPLGNHFITYFGGLEALIKEFPKLWSLIGFSLIPWIIVNHHSIKVFVINLFN